MNKNKIACELAHIVYDEYAVDAYGLHHCKKEYIEGDKLEKVLQLYILETGHNCNYYRDMQFPKLDDFKSLVHKDC